MALKTDYLDDILNADINTRRKYNIIQNDDGTVSFEDVTEYSQVGTLFGAEQVNEITREVNRSKDELAEKISKDSIIDNPDTDAPDLPVSARQVKILNEKVPSLIELANGNAGSDITLNPFWDISVLYIVAISGEGSEPWAYGIFTRGSKCSVRNFYSNNYYYTLAGTIKDMKLIIDTSWSKYVSNGENKELSKLKVWVYGLK